MLQVDGRRQNARRGVMDARRLSGMSFRLAPALSLLALVSACAGPADRLLDTDHVALLAACRGAMASIPPPGPPVDPDVYRVGPEDPRYQELRARLDSRTVTFEAKGNSPWVADPRLPPEVLRIEPLRVVVTPDAVYMALCGAGLSCSASALRAGVELEAVRPFKGGQPDCRPLREGLWYCHE